MRIFLYILLIGISTLISCSGSPDPLYPRYTTFPDEKMVATQEISIDSAFFRYPYRVAVKDSIAIIMDLHNDSHYFYAFTYPEWKPIAPFGKRGEAPGEMLSAEMFQFSALDSVWTLDANRMLITRWSVSPTDKTVLRKEEIRLDKTLVRSLDFYRTDSAFLITDYLGDFRYHKVSHSGKPIKNIGKIPTEISYEQYIHPALAQAWRSFTDYNPKNGIYAMATQLGEALEIYNLKTQTHNVIYGPAGEPQFIAKGGEGFHRHQRVCGHTSHRRLYLYRFRWDVLERAGQILRTRHVCFQRRPFLLRVRFGRKPGSKIYARQKYLGHPYQ